MQLFRTFSYPDIFGDIDGIVSTYTMGNRQNRNIGHEIGSNSFGALLSQMSTTVRINSLFRVRIDHGQQVVLHDTNTDEKHVLNKRLAHYFARNMYDVSFYDNEKMLKYIQNACFDNIYASSIPETKFAISCNNTKLYPCENIIRGCPESI